MNAVLAIIADGRRAIVVIDREAVEKKQFSHLLYNFALNPSTTASYNPFRRGFQGWGMLGQQNHAVGEETAPSWWGCLCVCVWLAKSIPSVFRSCQNGFRC